MGVRGAKSRHRRGTHGLHACHVTFCDGAVCWHYHLMVVIVVDIRVVVDSVVVVDVVVVADVVVVVVSCCMVVVGVMVVGGGEREL